MGRNTKEELSDIITMYMEGKKTTTIARKYGMTPGAVGAIIYRARKRGTVIPHQEMEKRERTYIHLPNRTKKVDSTKAEGKAVNCNKGWAKKCAYYNTTDQYCDYCSITGNLRSLKCRPEECTEFVRK